MAGRGDRGNGGHSGSILGSLKDALAAASRTDGRGTADLSDTSKAIASEVPVENLKDVTEASKALDEAAAVRTASADKDGEVPPPLPTRAADAAREARGGRPNVPPVRPGAGDDIEPTTHVVRDAAISGEADPAQTQLVRGKQKVERGGFQQDPVVGWLVIIGGPGLGSFRPIFEGNNTVGRGPNNRIAIDFGDEAISNEEQAYIRYDSADRSFLLVPNLSKTNVVSVNDKRPTSAVSLVAMDLITMGRTQLVFVPFCGSDFDWSDLSELSR